MKNEYYLWIIIIICIVLLGFYYVKKSKKLTPHEEYSLKIDNAQLNKELYLNANLEEREDLLFNYTFKVAYDLPINEMPTPLRVYFLIQILEMEVSNGGLLQFFTNSSGENAKETVESLALIKADNFKQILEKAMDIIIKYGENHETLNNKLSNFNKLQIIRQSDLDYNEEMSDALQLLDSEFFDYPDNLSKLKWEFFNENLDGLWEEIKMKYEN